MREDTITMYKYINDDSNKCDKLFTLRYPRKTQGQHLWLKKRGLTLVCGRGSLLLEH